MKNSRIPLPSALALAGILLAPLAPASRAVEVVIDYSHDTFFAGNPTALATLEKAADDVSAAITTTLAALSQDVYAGTNLSTTATANWALTYSHPVTGATQTLGTFSLGANEFRLYVGFASLPGSTVGEGGPGGASIGFSLSGFGSEIAGAVDAMEAASDASMPRGGPLNFSLSGNLTLQAVTTPYEMELGFTVGSATFDSDAGTVWHFDYGSAVPGGAIDFYSVAVHEMLHAVGFGISETWESLATGTNWAGGEVISLLGSGTGVLTADGGHIASGLQGHPLVDGVFQTGVLQEAALDPSLTTGTRKYLTDLDLAFLRDIGWQTIPEPSAALLFAVSGVALAAARRRS